MLSCVMGVPGLHWTPLWLLACSFIHTYIHSDTEQVRANRINNKNVSYRKQIARQHSCLRQFCPGPRSGRPCESIADRVDHQSPFRMWLLCTIILEMGAWLTQ